MGTSMPETDRAVQALLDENWPLAGEFASNADLAEAVSIALRVIRDDMYIAYQAGQVRSVEDVEAYLNLRIKRLSGASTNTGDTTEGPAWRAA